MSNVENNRLELAFDRLNSCQISSTKSTSTNIVATRTRRRPRRRIREIGDRLFIKLNLTSNKTHKGQQQFKSPNDKNLLALLLIIMMLAFQSAHQAVSGQQQQQQQQQQPQQETKTNLPTVIVRGFLNYRTTVDGTVLLFTPDAGGSSTTQSTSQLTLSTSSPALLMSSSSQLIEPSSTRARFATSTSFQFPTVEPRELPDAPVGRGGSGSSGPEAADEWRPIQATPPLRTPIQTVFRPQPQQASSVAASGSLELIGHLHTPVIGLQQDKDRSSQPSVQSEDVAAASSSSSAAEGQNLPISSSGSVAASEASVSTSSPPVPATAGSGHSRATRPKRPSLGFTGQGTRGGARSAASRVQATGGNQASGEASTSINGIRRPGLIGGISSTTPAPSGGSGVETSSTPAINSFQQRLANARLKNRFNKRPPIGNSSSSQSVATAAQQVGAVTPVATALLQPAESGEDLILSDQVAAQARAISPEQGALQSRIGDIFNPSTSFVTTPVVGNEEVWSAAAAAGSEVSANQRDQTVNRAQIGDSQLGAGGDGVILEPVADTSEQSSDNNSKLISRSGEQRPRADHLHRQQLLSGGLSGSIDLQQGQLSNAPLSFEGFFPNEQPSTQSSGSDASGGFQVRSEQQQSNHPRSTMKNNNDKISGWMGQHNNKFIPRPQLSQSGDSASPAPGHLSHQLAANLNNLVPSFSSNIPSSSAAASLNLKPTPVSAVANEFKTTGPSVGSLEELDDKEAAGSNMSNSSNNTNNNTTDGFEKDSIQMQTITKTYSTVMTSLKTRLVPLQVKSSTAIYTITENYVITKMLTAYQTMPLGEFILPEPQNTRSPFEMFSGSSDEKQGDDKANKEQPISAPSNHIAPSVQEGAPVQQAEQPISLDTSNNNKSPNDWLHDFSNLNSNPLNQQQTVNQQQQQQNNLAALLEQQAQEANLAGLNLGEPLDQLASSLDPAADGTINIPDLNNPLVLAAAIQNPQLAAVILAAQQLQLKQRANKLNNLANQQQQQQQQQQSPGAQINAAQLQPSYSTSLSTTIRPSTYTVRDTMYTTRLVSFKDGRTVRTRTVSEPGSVIEQVLTSMATEVTPITITIRPTGMLTGTLATTSPSAASSNQNTINNALIATQLASLLNRRQQQVQPSLSGQNFNPFAAPAGSTSNQSNQLAVLQQLLGQQQRQQQQQQQQQQQVAKYQPNIQQLLQSMQQPQQQQQQQQPSTSPSSLDTANNSNKSPVAQQEKQQQQSQQDLPAPTPSLPALPLLPITTTLTSLQVRTYTVHNAFKTIYRTITSTQLITSTIFPGVRNSQLPNLG